MSYTTLKSGMTINGLHLHCKLKPRGWPHAHMGGAETRNIFPKLLTFIKVLWDKVSGKSEILRFRAFLGLEKSVC